jgi:hypothetical protein
MPSAAEGGVVAMLLSDPSGGTTTAAPPSLPDCGDDVGGTGRERLHQMLDGLPAEPAPRLTPDDVEVETPDPAPPAVWFWGDDDIYPDRVPGSSDGRAGRRRRRSLGRPGTA